MFSFFTRKESLLSTALLDGMTDIHAHLLPGVDDGVVTMEESIRTLTALARLGVRRMYLTSHVMDTTDTNYKALYQERFEELLSQKPADIELRLAAEYMLDMGFPVWRQEGLLAMNGRHVLVETSYMAPPPDLITLLYDLVLDGYNPIIAHPERYMYMVDSDYRDLKNKGCKLQLNLLSLSGHYGKRAEDMARILLKEGRYDHIGSDIHNWERYQKGIESIHIDKNEKKELTRLLENNHLVW
ncbi:protein-tyrosine phosphatase [Parabacteroides sp. PFB2-10]|uniref:tyrosine-protein phosphatase n=1 Tax=Parabacteroides sp. PFB2-10 TaxID=1742405 RepID=UPI002474A975|nr:CpsB/CapC family capsule biosynthesis tyrosine phosphatase [Parabacteroides sp. PFB2-10]MDH6312722.1 protein-tyrosine phosphatase [Parabacteroides sp. PFB2-10]